jgi:hypothetical protein
MVGVENGYAATPSTFPADAPVVCESGCAAAGYTATMVATQCQGHPPKVSDPPEDIPLSHSTSRDPHSSLRPRQRDRLLQRPV